MIKALIIDDEKHSCDNLQWQLKQYCPEVDIVAVCYSAEDGLRQIKEKHPQLIFLDVELGTMSGFEMLAALSEINFDIIFITAFDKYAIRAIKSGALDYLVKPVDNDELRQAVDKVINGIQRNSQKQLSALLSRTAEKQIFFQKIAFPTLHGFELVSVSDIVACESSSNYTTVFIYQGKSLLVSRTLKQIEELLDIESFFRIHHSFLVNLQYAIRYIKGEGGFLILQGELTVPVSRSRKEELLKVITLLSL